MSACECLCVIVISRIGAGGKPKYEKIRPYGGITHAAGMNLTPLQKQQKLGGLDFSRLPGFFGQKKDHADCIKNCVIMWWSIPDSIPKTSTMRM